MWEMPNPHGGLDPKALGSLCRPTIITIIIIIIVVVFTTIGDRR
jgi:hypothetical protein